MKLWLFSLFSVFCSLNVIGFTTYSWQDEVRPPAAKSSTTQEPQTLKVDKADQRTDDPDQILFDGWETPDFALVISGRLDGYIEPCGCTGLDNQKGGLLRRHTFLKQLTQDKGWNLVAIDTGNQINRTGEQSIIKLKTAWRGIFQTMGYQMASIGVDDLKTPLIELISTIENLNLGDNKPFVCANVDLFDDLYFKKYRIIEIAGRRLGVTAVLGDEELEKLRGVVDPDLKLTPMSQVLPSVIESLDHEKCDLKILIANSSLEVGRQLAQQFPSFDLVISANGVGEPTNAPERIESSGRVSSLVQVGNKGMHVGVIGFYTNGGKLVSRYQRVPLDARFEDSEEMKTVFLDYQDDLAARSLEELRIAPKPHPSHRQYRGSESCQECHEYAYKIWKEGHDDAGGPHFRATLDLTEPNERVWVKRDKDPECLSCHVTGWNPQGYFPYETGYTDVKQVELHGNGCENCHGPGSQHIDAENEDIEIAEDRVKKYAEEKKITVDKAEAELLEAMQNQFRQDMVVTLDQARKELCFNCHDLDNSPDFHHDGAFDEYWKKIEHNED